MDISKFHIYTVGRSAINKEPYTPLLEVLPIEALSYVDGEIKDNQEEMTVEGEDAFGQKYSDNVKTANTLQCTWFPFDSNRLTPPDIRRGERVLLWRYADTDKYYWTTTGLDDFLRRLETVVWAFSNTTDETVKKLTPDNCVYMEISTHLGIITLSTPKSHGEEFAYKLQLNYRKGIFIIMDDVGNYLEMDSNERSIILRNADGSILSLDKMVALLKTAKEINLDTKAYSLKCETAVINAKKSYYLETPKIDFKASMFKGTITTSTFTGIVTTQGLLQIQGGMAATPGSSGGGATAVIQIPLNINAAITSVGTFTNNGVNVGSTHKHPNPEGGFVGPPQ